MNKLIQFFIVRTKFVNLFTIAISLAGLYALWGMKRDLHPPFDFNYIVIRVVHPDLSPEEIERSITYPIEELLKNESQISEFTSRSNIGSVTINLKFDGSRKEIQSQVEKIKSKVQNLARLFPAGIRDLTIEPLDSTRIFVAAYGIQGLDKNNWSHHHLMEQLIQQIKSVPGINEVTSSFTPYQLFIRFDPKKLQQFGVNVSTIRQAIYNQFGEGNGIAFHSGKEKDLVLEFDNRLITPELIQGLPLASNSTGQKLTIGNVAKVSFDVPHENKSYDFLLNGSRAFDLTVFKNASRDALETYSDVQKVLDESALNKQMQITVLADGPYFINQQIQVLVANGIGGLLLVLGMLALTMGWRTSLMTAIGLPISYFGTFLLLRLMGQSIDLISLIAMILVVGNLVDDAVIFAERYSQRLSLGDLPEVAARRTARELIVPVTGTIATIIVAFIPILVLDSELATIFFAIPVVVATALLLSWLETFFILPNHLAHWVRTPQAERATRLFEKLGQKYGTALGHTLRFRYLYALASLGLLVGSLIVASRMPQDFSLSINPPQVEIFVELKENLPIEQTEALLKPIYDEISKISKSEVDYTSTSVGFVWINGKAYRGLKYASITLSLNKKETDTGALRANVLTQVEKILANFKSEKVAKIEAIGSDRGGGQRVENTARIEIRGQNEQDFLEAKKLLLSKIPNQGAIKEFIPPDSEGADRFRFAVDPSSLAAYGMNRSDLAFQIQALTGSAEVLERRQNGRWLKVFLEPGDNKEVSARIDQLMIQSTKHEDSFSIQNLGEWQFHGQTQTINHKNGERVLILDFKFDGEKTNEQVVKKDLERILDQNIRPLFPTLSIKPEDANAQDKAGREWTLKVVLWAAILIYLILALTLQSWTQPLIVGLPIPFAIMGVIWALKAHNLPLGMMSMIGLIGTMGVAVNDSIVMVHQINTLCAEMGRKTKELIIAGAVSRLRAITLTASCTLAGVFPTAYGIGGESGFTQPLAFSMGWGLTASLGLTLFIIPGMLMIFDDIEKKFHPTKNKILNWRLKKMNFFENKNLKSSETKSIEI